MEAKRRKLLNGEYFGKFIIGVVSDLMFLLAITLGRDKKANGNCLLPVTVVFPILGRLALTVVKLVL